MELLTVALASVGSIIALFILTKLIGNKQLSEANMFDYVNGITIGSIAAEMATSLEDDFLKPLLAMVIYAAFAILITKVANKSRKMRKLLMGKSILLFDDGKIYKKNLSKAGIDVNELLMHCRINGYFNLSELQTVLFETNGRLSFLPKSTSRPVNPEDMKLFPKQDKVMWNLIMDGEIIWKNLKYLGKDEQWLQNQVEKHGVQDMKDIFLACCDGGNDLSVYVKLEMKNDKTPFE